jgi:hypothetical protein
MKEPSSRKRECCGLAVQRRDGVVGFGLPAALRLAQVGWIWPCISRDVMRVPRIVKPARAQRGQRPAATACGGEGVASVPAATAQARGCRRRHAALPRVTSYQFAGCSEPKGLQTGLTGAMSTTSEPGYRRRPYESWPAPPGRSRGLPTCPRAPGPPWQSSRPRCPAAC